MFFIDEDGEKLEKIINTFMEELMSMYEEFFLEALKEMIKEDEELQELDIDFAKCCEGERWDNHIFITFQRLMEDFDGHNVGELYDKIWDEARESASEDIKRIKFEISEKE